MPERVQKIIAASGLMSRRAAEECIAQGRVTVNGTSAELGDRADPERDEIRVDGKPLPEPGARRYVMLHKPRGYVTTLSDERGRRCVTELLRDIPERIYPVGRLDMDSEGLLLLTNDGDFANRLMHPSHEVEKCYRTWVQGEDVGMRAELLRQPMEIDGHVIAPAEVDVREPIPGGAVLDITIHEGRNRQVRKMCQQAGLKVTRLVRIREGTLTLGDLPRGKWRDLTEEEVQSLRK
ncbi:MAG: rRNA pseudouridine synthase [Oscillospiraceae bacterium]|nr:rRNA pseudouridine synthase [Oscillospiraceae bacterium]